MGIFVTFQDFMLFTKGLTYVLIICYLLGITGFWLFLTEKDE